jgi:hypothetical protein
MKGCLKHGRGELVSGTRAPADSILVFRADGGLGCHLIAQGRSELIQEICHASVLVEALTTTCILDMHSLFTYMLVPVLLSVVVVNANLFRRIELTTDV